MAPGETARARRRLVEEAGWRTTSGISVLAGTLVAFGAVAIIAAGAGAAGSALGLDTDGISTDEWRRAGIVSAAIGALVVFLAFWFGGYTAGRMSRRAGARHGLLVFLLSVLLLAGIGLAGWAVSDDMSVLDDLAERNIPTDEQTWGDIGLGAGLALGVAMFLGSMLGGIRGDRWRGRLATAVMEHRQAVRDEELAHVDRHDVHRDDTDTDLDHAGVDRTDVVDIRDHDDHDDHALTVEEEREHEHHHLH